MLKRILAILWLWAPSLIAAIVILAAIIGYRALRIVGYSWAPAEVMLLRKGMTTAEVTQLLGPDGMHARQARATTWYGPCLYGPFPGFREWAWDDRCICIQFEQGRVVRWVLGEVLPGFAGED